MTFRTSQPILAAGATGYIGGSPGWYHANWL